MEGAKVMIPDNIRVHPEDKKGLIKEIAKLLNKTEDMSLIRTTYLFLCKIERLEQQKNEQE
jgi:hypothetical protein